MATVVNLQRDTRAAELGQALGQGVASFLERKKDRRLDVLQQELMSRISEAGTELEASALLGDKRFTEITTDNDRLPAIITHLNTVPFGFDSIAGFDENGSQQLISFPKGGDPAQVLRDNNLNLEKRELKFAIDETDPISTPRLLGRFASNTEALEATDNLLEGESVVGSEAAKIFVDFRERTDNAKVRRQRQILAERKQNFDEKLPLSSIGDFVRDMEDGIFTEDQAERGFNKITFTAGRTPEDIAAQTKIPLEKKAATLVGLSGEGVFLAKTALAEPALLAKVGVVPRTLNALSAELVTIAGALGIPVGQSISLEEFEKLDSFAARSTAFKNNLFIFTLNFARSEGQSGRNLTLKEFKLFQKVTGTNISNANIFATNMNSILATKQRTFKSEFRFAQKGEEFEATHELFPTLFGTKDTAQEKREELEDIIKRQREKAGRVGLRINSEGKLEAI